MILTGAAIARAVATGELVIDFYDPKNINPNSYNVHLSSILLAYDNEHSEVPVEQIIPSDGLVLAPRRLYLGATVERFGGPGHVTCLISRSSVARLGLFVQLNADMGNTGAVHSWTLELMAVQPIRVYPNMRVAQITFWRTQGLITQYVGEYSEYDTPRQCRYSPYEMTHNLEEAAS